MADYVEQAMQEMVPELDDLRRKKLFADEEIRHIVRRRRDFEYGIQRKPGKPQDYLNYVRYEIALESLRRRRSMDKGWRKRSVSDFAGIKRVHHLLHKASSRFKGNKKLWYQHVDFCLRSGSTKSLNRVLLRAIKFHPKEVPLWLLAADRELQQGHISAARKLLLRGLRSSPRSVKLLTEFLRLEAGVAAKVLSSKALAEEEGNEDPSSDAGADLWAPARLLLRRGLGKLALNPIDSAIFLVSAEALMKEAAVKWSGSAGFAEWSADLRKAAEERRPGALADAVGEAEATKKAWEEVPDDSAADIWEVWWNQEQKTGTKWTALAAEVSGKAPCPVFQRLAKALIREICQEDSEDAQDALLKLAASPRSPADPETALTLLESLSHGASFTGARESRKASTYKELLQQAAKANPGHLRLGLLAGRELAKKGDPAGAASAASALLRRASNLEDTDAAQLFLLVTSDSAQNSSGSSPGRGKQLPAIESLLRTLGPGQDPLPLVTSFLTEAMVRGGEAEFRKACQDIRKVAQGLWEVPGLRAGVLAAALQAELRIPSTSSPSEAKRLCTVFEDLLGSMEGPAGETFGDLTDWWLRYAEFAQRSQGVPGVPNSSDLHCRALRAVPDQAYYQERSQRLLDGGMATN
eukprot:TRINITY_DN21006_c0_g1_i2.p1 TRINITY_DN21006_c0_g1~~TRINITY_DN21006_c0_g1_i2.p1  ORF type:complete len:639 (+),score=167.67 TRINITY_DN21006_c0_g1_i2:109-2025(+)